MTLLRTLYHFPLDPHSRQVRLALTEKRLPFDEVIVRYWEPDPTFESLNPSGLLPVLVEQEQRTQRQLVVCECRAILDHLEESAPTPALWPRDLTERAEARRLVGWFERKFDYEVNALLLHEKMEKRLMGLGAPDMQALRSGREAMKGHLSYFDHLLAGRDWLAGRHLSFADFAAGAHLSVLDYFGDPPWKDYPNLKTWYMALKSRPAFRALLMDRLPGVPPAGHYDDLDF